MLCCGWAERKRPQPPGCVGDGRVCCGQDLASAELRRAVLADGLVILTMQCVLTLGRLTVLHLLQSLSGHGWKAVMPSVEQIVPRHGKLGHDTSPELVPTAQWLIVHLRRRYSVADVVLVEEGRRRRVQKGVDVTHRLVRTGPLLQVDRGRVRDRRTDTATVAHIAHRRHVVVAERVREG